MKKAILRAIIVSALLSSIVAGVQTVKAEYGPSKISKIYSASISHSANTTIDVNQAVEFWAHATGGTPPYTYQWYSNETPISAAVSSIFRFIPNKSGTYQIYVTVSDSSPGSFFLIRHQLDPKRLNSSLANVIVLDTVSPAPAFSSSPNPSPPLSWVAKAPMPTARFSFGVATVNGRIYVIGGAVNYSSALLAVNEEYDPNADKWNEKAPMLTPTYGVAVAVYENKIYVFGGEIDNNSTLTERASTLVYDPSTDNWAFKAPMPIARNLLQANVVGDKIYLIGGYPYANATLNEVYDPATDTWTTKAPLPIPAIAYASAVVDSKIYVISGASFENATSPVAVLSSTQIYDSKTDTWSSGAPIPTPIASAGVGVIIDAEGRKAIYVVGGETDIFSPQTIVQIYFPENNSWSIGSSLPASRSRLCVAVANNALYAIGGTRIIGHQGLSENAQYSLFGTVPSGFPSFSPSSSPSPSIPEFPSWILLAVILILATFVAAAIQKKH